MQGARIGPNAITQLLAPIEHHCGHDTLEQVLGRAGISRLPDMSGLIDEDPAIRLHQALRVTVPEEAPEIAREAGLRTAEYILANRIPAPARALLPWLPPRLSARLLAKAVSRHAWTFAGSGAFRIGSTHPLVFEIAHNPLAADPPNGHAMCHWHQAVFERMFRSLVHRRVEVDEVQCCGRGDACCAFVIFI